MSTLVTLRTLFADQVLDGDTVNSSSDPTATLVDNYINKAIRQITRRDRPHELMSDSAVDLNIAVNTNTVAITTDIIVVDEVYYKQSASGRFRKMEERRWELLVDRESPGNFFDNTNTGDPNFYAVRGTSLIFNKFFDRTETAAIKVFGLNAPTVLSSDSDTTELPIDYDLLITYESAVYFFQRDDDVQNQVKYQNLANIERNNLFLDLVWNQSDAITLDPRIFSSRRDNIQNPNVFFTL